MRDPGLSDAYFCSLPQFRSSFVAAAGLESLLGPSTIHVSNASCDLSSSVSEKVRMALSFSSRGELRNDDS